MMLSKFFRYLRFGITRRSNRIQWIMGGLLAVFSLGSVMPTITWAEDDGSIIDVMIVYTASAKEASANDIKELNQQIIENTNTSYTDSGVNQRLRLIHTEQVSYEGDRNGLSLNNILSDLRISNGSLENVHKWRDRHLADVVVLLVGNNTTQGCGVAYRSNGGVIPEFESSAFAVVKVGCAKGTHLGAYGFAHQLGHLMGCPVNYSEKVDGKYPIMTHVQVSGLRINRWSNSCATILNNTAKTVANFRYPKPGTLQFPLRSISVSENVGIITSEITRTGGKNGQVSVEVSTESVIRSAEIGSDYTVTPFPTTLTWNDLDDSSQFITINIEDDNEIEETERIRFVLSNSMGGAELTSQHTSFQVSIRDNDGADIAFVIDVTGSMGFDDAGNTENGEIIHVKKFLTDYIQGFVKEIEDGKRTTAPSISLLVFRDTIKNYGVTDDLALVQERIDNLYIAGGDDCPEASVEAMLEAAKSLKQGGGIWLFTDAAPHPGLDLDATIADLTQKGLRIQVKLKGNNCGDSSATNFWPTVSSISPSTATLNELTTFTIEGNYLTADTAFWIDQCEEVTQLSGGTETQRQFKCTPSWSTGTKEGVVKDKSGGNVLLDFEIKFEIKVVEVVEPEPTGGIQVTVEPAEARDAGAMWEAMIWGIGWVGPYESGKTMSGFKKGDTPIRFTDIVGWQTLAEISVSVVAGSTVTTNATYIPITFPLNVNTVGNGTIEGGSINCGSHCSEKYEKGTEITLTATPDLGWRLKSWSGACSGTENCAVTMNTNQNVTATFEKILPKYVLSVIKTGTGNGTITGQNIDCGSDCTEEYTENTPPVTLNAVPSAGSRFIGWNGGNCSGTEDCAVTMNTNQNVTATFERIPPKYVLSVIKTGTGNGTITGQNIDCGSDCTEEYTENTPPVTLNAVPSAGSRFIGWSGDCSGTSSCQPAMTANNTVTATFSKENNVTLLIVPPSQSILLEETFEITLQVQAENQPVDSVTLELRFDPDFLSFEQLLKGSTLEQEFPNPSSNCDSNQGCIGLSVGTFSAASGNFDVATIHFTPKQSGSTELYFTETNTEVLSAGQSLLKKTTEVEVEIEEPKYQLTVNKIGMGKVTGEGIECGSDCIEEYPVDTQITLTADADVGHTFSGWSGAGCRGTENCMIVISTQDQQEVTATFVEMPILTVNIVGTGHVTGQNLDCRSNCTEEYTVDTPVVLLTAEPDDNSQFMAWEDACSGTIPSCQVTMDESKTVIAKFVEVEPEDGDSEVVLNLISPAQSTFSEGDTFDIIVQVQAGNQEIDSIGIGLNFDADVLDFNQWQLEHKTLTNLYDNTTERPTPSSDSKNQCEITQGCIDIQFGSLQSPANGTFNVATLSFTVLNQTENPKVNLNDKTEILFKGEPVHHRVSYSTSISDPPPPPLCFTSGLITATCDAQGQTLTDVTLAADISITNAILEGTITGDVNAPALLEDVEVKENSHLSGVIISNTVTLGRNVEFGEGVRFSNPQLIPTDIELTDLLPILPDNCPITPLKRIDLSADVLEPPSEGILAAINALPDIKDNNWEMTQDVLYGYLQLTIDTIRFAEQPILVKSINNPTALEILEQQSVRFITDTGIMVLSHPAIQAPCTLQSGLADINLPGAILQTNGNLRIPAGNRDESWFSTRPDWLATELSNDSNIASGLFLMDSPTLTGTFFASVIFQDNSGTQRQQFFYPAIAKPNILSADAQDMIIEPDGLVSFKLGEQSYRGVIDYLVKKGTPPDTGILQIEPIADMNGDGIEDWVLIYPDGENQRLFQVKEEVVCLTSDLRIPDFSKGEVWINDECKPLPTTTGSDGPIVTKADGTSGTSDANFSGGWSENGGPYKSTMTYGGGEVTITQVIHFDPAHVGKEVDIFILLNLYFLPDGQHWYQVSDSSGFIMWNESPATIEAFETHTIVAGESKVIGPYNLGVLEGLPTSDAKFDFGYRINNGTIITTGVPTTLEVR